MLDPVNEVILVGPGLQRKLGNQGYRQADQNNYQGLHFGTDVARILTASTTNWTAMAASSSPSTRVSS